VYIESKIHVLLLKEMRHLFRCLVHVIQVVGSYR